MARPEFELVRSFAISGANAQRVDLYRIIGDVNPVSAVDLRFPSFTDREFLHILPVTR